jgi:hypothetical protein
LIDIQEFARMTLSQELLVKAEAAGIEMGEADNRALVARTEYHTAIRRLHLAGGSLREIAHALTLSHQRVQQIVRGAGGSWWSRMWRTRNIRPDAICTWCTRPPSEVSKLIAGPHVYVCESCVEAAERMASAARPTAPFLELKRKGAVRCSFCAKRANKDRLLVSAPAGNICADCLRSCREILDGRAG